MSTIDEKHNASIPAGRFARMARLGSLATGVAGGMIAEGARQLAQGNRPKVSDLLLTPANAKRVADELARLRGAAMKVGQLLSMDAGDMLPAELTDILSRLRSDAKPMPLSQLAKVLDENWGKGWNTRFQQFSFQPLAAASIGQVHSAHTKDGRHLALKIQYPGVRESISSDVDNVAALLRISGLIPKGIDYQPLLEEAKQQLHQEADYLQEAAYIRRYQELLADSPEFALTTVHDDFTTVNILAMTHIGGVPIESLAHAPQEERDHVMHLLLGLLFREIFSFRLVQTDPNFANYRYDRAAQQLILLDFGATRAYPESIAEGYRQVMQGAVQRDRAMMDAGAAQIGFFQAFIKPEQRAAVLDLFEQACEPLRWNGVYDFGTSSLASRIRDAGMALSMEQDYWHTPPADALFLHRKLGGLYLLAAKLRARVDVAGLFAAHLS
ncbi:ABC1 kinase family protein [Thiothrix fructosivorans]|uniref:AarF/ABC1/UbiB kinase family protein n=1 Tax=Thiothrix fructosivorans TaxID=111770 RepID=A0A8B0SD82_9GAMM|nr:AarF/ABC1/UbiB kinase family protein [Thiothrix fructosivorans]MBO0615165.1 AarF/ABC1/UbiB kinase family protein [Thiothrix fructosivorans]QTX09953.1 AarF/ABC1/UbiB kinase family protein [Thiothrix fructosivorans]